jgi:hypothetical protein
MKTPFFLITITLTYFATVGVSSTSYAFSPRSSGFSSSALYPFALAYEGHEHAPAGSGMQMSEEEEHEHSMLEIPTGQLLPTVSLISYPDPQRGWNLEIQVTNFKFAPENINQPSIPTEGHAHLYVDGKKITRLYSNWYYLENLAPGKHEITVSLNTNGHETLMHDGKPIQATIALEVPMPTAK